MTETEFMYNLNNARRLLGKCNHAQTVSLFYVLYLKKEVCSSGKKPAKQTAQTIDERAAGDLVKHSAEDEQARRVHFHRQYFIEVSPQSPTGFIIHKRDPNKAQVPPQEIECTVDTHRTETDRNFDNAYSNTRACQQLPNTAAPPHQVCNIQPPGEFRFILPGFNALSKYAPETAPLAADKSPKDFYNHKLDQTLDAQRKKVQHGTRTPTTSMALYIHAHITSTCLRMLRLPRRSHRKF